MKIIIKKDILNEKLNIVSRAISNKNIIPVLGCIKFDLKPEGLFLTTSNEDITIETTIDKKNIKEIVEPGAVVIPKKFLDIIRKLESEYITLETENLKLIINNYEDGYLNCMDPYEFPNIKIEEQKDPIILKQEILKTMVNETSFAISTQESRPVLTGLNLVLESNTLECTATDSYRLAKKTINIDQKQKDKISIVVPGKNMVELTKILLNDDENIELHIFSNSILFKTNDMLFLSRLLNNTYPDTSKLLQNEYEIKLSVNLQDFYKSIDYVSLLTSDKDKNLIKMGIKEKNMKITCTHETEGELTKTLQLTTKPEENITIAYSSKYMLDALKVYKSENIELCMNGEIKPIIIKSPDDDSLIQLILPIKTF